MSRPANVEVFESHSGAETMPVRHQHGTSRADVLKQALTVLDQDVEALLNEQ